jgi:nicotinamide-nucleotide amidase
MNYKNILENIITETVSYLDDNPGIESMILGISGGIDSAVTAVIASMVAKKTGVKLFGRYLYMPSGSPTNFKQDKNTVKLGTIFCDDFDLSNSLYKIYNTITCGTTYEPSTPQMPGLCSVRRDRTHDEKVRHGNIMARLRMMYLYNLAHLHKGMVLSTDNYTEYMLGFWTLHGDVGDFGMIQNLWKNEVYKLAWHLVGILDDDKAELLQYCIEVMPTDGLGITNTDFDQMGVDIIDNSGEKTYSLIDRILAEYAIGDASKWKDHPVIQRHLATKFKRNNPYNIDRWEIVK